MNPPIPIVQGDDLVVAVQLHKDDATFNISNGATVRAAITSNGGRVLQASSTCSFSATGADWSTSLVVVEGPPDPGFERSTSSVS